MRSRRIRFSGTELRDLFKAWLAISVAFTILITRTSDTGVFIAFALSAITVGTGFLLHELGHKFVAQRYGCFAEFRSFDNMLVLAILMSFLGFILAAPGAVMISGYVSRARNGKISMAGPLVNIVLAVLFLIMALTLQGNVITPIATYGFRINAWIGLFNMIPVWNFDGRKILDWSKGIYGAMVVAAFVLSFMI